MRQKGFTLIELMIVVAILGILASIAIPNLLKFQCRKRGEGAGFHPRLAYYMCSGKHSHCKEDDKRVCLNALKNGEARLEDFFGPDVVHELRHQYKIDNNMVMEDTPEPTNNCSKKIKELETEINVLKSLISGDLNTPEFKPKQETWKE